MQAREAIRARRQWHPQQREARKRYRLAAKSRCVRNELQRSVAESTRGLSVVQKQASDSGLIEAQREACGRAATVATRPLWQRHGRETRGSVLSNGAGCATVVGWRQVRRAHKHRWLGLRQLLLVVAIAAGDLSESDDMQLAGAVCYGQAVFVLRLHAQVDHWLPWVCIWDRWIRTGAG